MQDRRQSIGLFRYSLIRELADPGLTPRRRGELTRALAEQEHALPEGGHIQVTAHTLRRWLRKWRAGGFEALVPDLRHASPKLPADLLSAAVTLKREAPERSAVQVARILAEAGRGQIAERTLQRQFARLGLNVRPDGSSPQALGRFQAEEFGQLWTGDGLHGPQVDGAKAILFAFIDDWSRAVPGWRWGHAEDTVRLDAALRRGLESAGVPDAIFVDRGSVFISARFHRTLAVLGVRIIHSRAGHAPSRGKIERFFGTVRRQFLVELQTRGGARDLGEMNELFGAWLEGVYHRTRHSETGQTPSERRLAGRQLRRPTPQELHLAFQWQEKRRVSKTASVSLFGNHYEVDAALVGAFVELLFDPFDLSRIDVTYQGRPMGRAVPMRIGRHVHPAVRQPVAPPPKASGIDYLALVSERLAREERSRLGITYARLPGPTEARSEEENC